MGDLQIQTLGSALMEVSVAQIFEMLSRSAVPCHCCGAIQKNIGLLQPCLSASKVILLVMKSFCEHHAAYGACGFDNY